MRLLYIASIDFYTKPNPSFHLMTSMLQDVLASGIGVDYIGCAEEGLAHHIPDELAQNPEFAYHLIPIHKIEKSHFVQRYLDGIRYSMKIRRAIKRFRDTSNVIFVQSSPTVLYTLLSAKRYAKGKNIIYNVQDMFPGSSIASGVMPKRWMQRVFYHLQKIAYKRADVITAISEDMKTKLLEQGVPESKIQVIVNWFDDKSVHEVKRSENRFVAKCGMAENKFYVQYAGTMGYVFDYEMVLDVAERLLHYDDIVFQMIGEGSQKSTFMKEAEQRGLKNIVFLPLEPQNMVSDVYSACSVCIIPLKKGIIGNSVPSKAGLLMACRRAIVTTSDEGSNYNDMINKNGIGIACSADDPNAAAEAILKMRIDKVFRETCASSGQKYGGVLYCRTKNTRKYIDLFRINCTP